MYWPTPPLFLLCSHQHFFFSRWNSAQETRPWFYQYLGFGLNWEPLCPQRRRSIYQNQRTCTFLIPIEMWDTIAITLLGRVWVIIRSIFISNTHSRFFNRSCKLSREWSQTWGCCRFYRAPRKRESRYVQSNHPHKKGIVVAPVNSYNSDPLFLCVYIGIR